MQEYQRLDSVNTLKRLGCEIAFLLVEYALIFNHMNNSVRPIYYMNLNPLKNKNTIFLPSRSPARALKKPLEWFNNKMDSAFENYLNKPKAKMGLYFAFPIVYTGLIALSIYPLKKWTQKQRLNSRRQALNDYNYLQSVKNNSPAQYNPLLSKIEKAFYNYNQHRSPNISGSVAKN